MPGKKNEFEYITLMKLSNEHYPPDNKEFFDVKSGAHMLVILCEHLQWIKPERFEKLPDLFRPWSKKRWFSRSPDGMHHQKHIGGTTVWLDANMSTKNKKQFANELMQFFGYNREDISFHSFKRTAAIVQ